MRPLFYSSLLYSIADQMVGLFLPLFLFEIGQQMTAFVHFGISPFVSGILFVALYYALQRVVVLVTVFPLGKWIKHIGYIKSMVIGTLVLCGNYVGFYFAKADAKCLVLSFVCGGISMVLYWVAHDSLFAREINSHEIGRGVGALTFLTKALHIAVPALSGLVIIFWGYNVLFAIGIFFLLLSCIPLFFIPKTIVHTPPTFRQFLLWLRERRFQKFAMVQVGKYMDIIALLMWPVYVLLVVGKVERVGYFYSLVLFLSLVLTYAAGWFVDHKKGRRAFILSGTLISCIWIVRMFVRGIWDLLGVEFVEKLAASIYGPCYDSFLCSRSKGKSVLAFHVYKEFLLSIDATLLWVLVVILFLLPVAWTSIFLLGAVGMVLSLFMDEKK